MGYNVSEAPLIYTTKGNLPVDQLEYQTGWIDTPEYTQFMERYLLDGEVVKESSHVYHRKGATFEGETAQL